MAPSPEQRNEPKAPDKSDNNGRSTDNAPGSNIQIEPSKNVSSSKATTDSQKKELSDLNDGQLKELLEEAVSYKCPQDKQGKSEIFLELLEKAEEDERNQRATNASGSQVARHYNTAYSQPRSRRSKETSAAERNSHGGSLQNLYHQVSNEHAAGKRTSRKKSSVSARQREGGSLPSCNSIVPSLDKITFDKPVVSRMEHQVKPEYTAGDLCSAEPDEMQGLMGSSGTDVVERKRFYDGEDGTEMKPIPRVSATRLNYTTRASLEVAENRKISGLPSDIDSSITISMLETLPSSVKCMVDSQQMETAAVSSRNLSILNFTPNLALPQKWIINNKDSSSAEKKSFDENGNNVNSFSSLSGNDHRKKQKSKSKADRNVIEFDPKDIKGYCGDKDVDSLVKFIESNSNEKPPKSNKHVVNNLKTNKNYKEDDDKNSKKRSNERRSKDKNEKLKKSNSLEEISKTKLEDLTTEDNANVNIRRTAKKQTTFDESFTENNKGDRRSWGTEEGQKYYCADNNTDYENNIKKKVKPDIINTNTEPNTGNPGEITATESSEFLVVTKKKKSKKRRSSSGGGGGGQGNLFNEENRRNNYYQRGDNYNQSKFQAHEGDMLYFQKSPEHRRKSTCSMPPSDKSNDSSDLDSVHSLPVESTSSKPSLQQVSASSGGTPQASYADIARMANGTANVVTTDTKQEKNVAPKNGPQLMPVKNYNFPDLIDSCNYYNDSNCDKIFTVTEIEARHLSEAKMIYNESKRNKEMYPALEKTVPPPPSKGKQENAVSVSVLTSASKKSDKSKCDVKQNKSKGCDNNKKNCPISNTSQECCNSDSVPKKQSKQTQSETTAAVAKKTPSTSKKTVPVSASCRPPVIILNDVEFASSGDSSGITFGFEVNEKLLLGDNGDIDNVVVPAVSCSVSEEVCSTTGGGQEPSAKCVVPGKMDGPATTAVLNYNHEKIVTFVGLAWEDIVNQQSTGKVKYFSEQ